MFTVATGRKLTCQVYFHSISIEFSKNTLKMAELDIVFIYYNSEQFSVHIESFVSVQWSDKSSLSAIFIEFLNSFSRGHRKNDWNDLKIDPGYNRDLVEQGSCNLKSCNDRSSVVFWSFFSKIR